MRLRARAWRRGRWGHGRRHWDPYFALCYLVAVAMVAGNGQTEPVRRVAVVALFSLIGLCYLVLGRPAILDDDEGWRGGGLFVAAIAVLFGLAVGFEESSTFALFAICPMVFLSLRFRYAAAVVALLNLLPPVVVGVQESSLGQFSTLLPTAGFGLAFALLFGTYIDRILRQSAERAELIAQLEASRAEVGRLSHAAGVAAERTRLAGEIHDTLAQGFTSIVTLLQAAEADVGRDDARVGRRLDLAVRTARENLAEARALVAALGPLALESGPLDEAVRRLVERTGDELGIPATFDAQGAPGPVPTAVEVVLLRAAQEALSNVRKHAAAGTLTARLSYRDCSVGLLVRDDGKGFEPGARLTGFGLPGMRKRVEEVGGSLTVHSAPGAGTGICVEVPL
jgi:signal transduction histidine kinase